MPKAKTAALTALKLDESLAEAHAALGFIHLIYDWDGPAAERELQRAIQLNPSLATARLNYAAYLSTQGRHDEGVQEIRRAVELDPLSLRTHSVGASLLMFARRYDEAIELARKGLELDPNFAFSLAFQGVAYAEQGRFQEAVSNLQKAAQLDKSPTILALGAHVHAVAGQKGEAKKLIQAGGGRRRTALLLPVRNRRCIREPWRPRHRRQVVSQRRRGSSRLHGLAGR